MSPTMISPEFRPRDTMMFSGPTPEPDTVVNCANASDVVPRMYPKRSGAMISVFAVRPSSPTPRRSRHRPRS
jgi:hypothetical protein